MAANLITYTDKSNNSSSALAANKKVADVDMNEIKTTVNDNAALHDALQTQVDTLEGISGAVPLMYTYSDTLVEADPGAGNFRFDFIDPNSATYLYISKSDMTFDTLGLWGVLSVGSYIYIKTRSDLTGGGLFVVGAITDNSTWLKLTIASVDGGVITNGDICAVQMFIPAVAGSGDVATDLIWDAKGDLAVGTGSNTAIRLAAGTDTHVLTLDSATATGLKWAAGGSGAVATDVIWDAKGDGVFATGADAATKLTAGANGQIITYDSTIANGVKVTNFVYGFGVQVGALDTDLATGAQTGATFRPIKDFIVTEVSASVTTAPTGATLVFDINDDGTTILSTKLSIDIGEKTSRTAATQPVISAPNIAADSEVTIDIDQIGSTVAGQNATIFITGYTRDI